MLSYPTPPPGGGLYVIWLSDRHYYGGRTGSFHRRWADHLRALRDGAHDNRFMQRVFSGQTFRPEAIHGIEETSDQIEAEQSWLDENFGRPGCMNLTSSALGGGGPITPEGRLRLSESQAGRILILKGTRFKRVRERSLPSWEEKGWRTGSPFEGTSWVFRDEEEARVPSKDVPHFLGEGWTLGRSAQPTLGSVCIHRGTEKRRATEDDVEDYLSRGWLLGWPFRGEKLAWVTRGKEEKRVGVSDLPLEETFGWVRGRVSSPKGQKIWVHLGSERKKILNHERSRFQGEGWELGMGPREARTVWVSRAGEARRVSPEEVERLQGEGWEPGQGKTGRVWAHHPSTGKIRLVPSTKIPNGWRLGRK